MTAQMLTRLERIERAAVLVEEAAGRVDEARELLQGLYSAKLFQNGLRVQGEFLRFLQSDFARMEGAANG